MRKELSSDKVIFNDKKRTIMIRGHFVDYICGTLTTVMNLAKSGALKGASAIWSAADDFPIADKRYEQGLILFDNDEDYKMTKLTIEAAFISAEDIWCGEEYLTEKLESLIRLEKVEEFKNETKK